MKRKGELILQKINEILEKEEMIVGVRSLSKRIGIPYPTVCKWVEIFNAQGKLSVDDFRVIKIIRRKR